MATRWMTTGQILDLLYAASPAVTAALFGTSSAFAIGLSNSTAPFTSPLAATPVLKYSSLAQFTADAGAGAITYPYQWVLYDCEYWNGSGQTPVAEYNSPVVAMQSFVTLAHAHGYQVILTPGRDLAQAPGTIFTYLGGPLDTWYEANNIAGGAAGTGADIVEIQTQADTLTGNYTSFWAAASAQAAAANPACPVFGGISVAYGTGTQMAAAALSVPAASGFWLNGTVPTTATSITCMKAWMAGQPAVVTAAPVLMTALTTVHQHTGAGHLPDVAPGNAFWALPSDLPGLLAAGQAYYAPAGTAAPRPEPAWTAYGTPGGGAGAGNSSPPAGWQATPATIPLT